MIYRFGVLAILSALAFAAPVQAKTICTLIVDAETGRPVLDQGSCDGRYTPASTFKIPLSVMGYDAGVVKDQHAPVFDFQEGDADWGGTEWKKPTDPVRWMKYSVVWYSQRLTASLGESKLHRYAEQFGYGNADFSGDPGKNNGLERAWIASSLKISAREQVDFLRRLITHQLPVSQAATDNTIAIVGKTKLKDGWTVHGKTGAAFSRRQDYSYDRDRPWGWFVGWAEKGGRTLIFARLIQEDRKTKGSAGIRTRDAFLKEFPALVVTD